MNGISFSDFENSSFESLYSGGFANAKHFDEAAKHMKPGDFMQRQLTHGNTAGMLSSFERPGQTRGAPAPMLQAPAPVQYKQALQPPASSSRDRHPLEDDKRAYQRASRSSGRAAGQAAPVPLNDMGVMPGNTRVDHAWKPSREAAVRAQHAVPAIEAPRSSAPASGNQGTFVGWTSN
eukprot:TRINITY_DN78325_c0_g1_i1.p1 TRINITY_DN78325_c0_g1~~TRINITY_DN78325_c0_g1_i1.p1  ORF type:complete len:178 (+),score=44.54 TRINITY_DN78325_c0_g1_i1:78-611(+)